MSILWTWASGNKVRIVIPFFHKSSPKHIYMYGIYIYICINIYIYID